jgi:hypothetical protein
MRGHKRLLICAETTCGRKDLFTNLAPHVKNSLIYPVR